MNEAPETQRHFGRDMWLAAMLVIAGVAIAGASVAQIRAQDRMHLAQAPTTEQYARGIHARRHASDHAGAGAGDAQAGGAKGGAQPALPPAPAEKVAPPIKDK